ESAWARIGLGKALCDEGRYWEGIKEYELVYEPGRFKDLLTENLQLTYAVLAHRYEKQLKNEPNNAEAHYGLGIVYSKTKRLPEAIRQFEEAVRLKPDLQDAWFNLGLAYEAADDLPKAAVGLERFLALGVPKETELLGYAYGHLAQIYEKLADSEKARKY